MPSAADIGSVRRSLPLLAALLALAALPSCRKPPPAARPAAPTKPFRVALLVAGSVDDGGWNQLAKQGLDQIGAQLGVQTSYQLAQKPDMVQAFRSYARGGYSLIIGHGAEFGSAVEQVAPLFPDTRFVISSGDVKGPNYTSIRFELAQAAYLAGILAASASRTAKAGEIGGENFAAVAQAFRAFEQGGKSYSPAFHVATDYVGDWQNAGKAKEQALAMIRSGADVLFQNADAAGSGVFQAARESSRVLVIGSNADQTSVAPEVVLASAVLGVPKAFVEVATDCRDGHLKRDFYVEDLHGTVNVVVNPRLQARIPKKARLAMEHARAQILAGQLVLPAAR